MNANRLLKGFDLIGDAPEAIRQFRKLVIGLAVAGKLNSSDDGPLDPQALAKVVDERKRAAAPKSGVRNRVPSATVSGDDLPPGFTNPQVFVQLGSIARIEKGPTGITKAEPGRYPLVVTAEERASCNHYDFIGAAAIVPLISSSGHGKASLQRLHYQEGEFALGSILAAIFPYAPELISARFIYEYLTAFKDELLVSRMIGTANVSLSVSKVSEVPVPLVPPTVQRTVDELMALCDQLEAARTEREAKRDRLATASFARLNTPDPDPARFANDARFTLNVLPTLTARRDQIRQLSQTILNLAVRGKLSPQCEEDMAAPSFGISDKERSDRIAMELPRGWSWTRIRDVASARLGKMLDKAKNSGRHHTYLRNTNVHWFTIRLDELKEMRLEDEELPHYLLRPSDLLVCEGGHGIGRCAVWEERNTEMVFQKALHRVRPGPALNGHFLSYCVFVYFHAGVLARYFTGVGIPHLTGQALAEIIFPLPPLGEQNRIVAKVDELMALCNRLEASLSNADTTRSRLLETLLADALAPVARELHVTH
jgi:type I restriction enzyme, S subunit